MSQASAEPTRYSERVTEILDGLEALVLAEGFRKLTLNDIARRLSVSYATLYKIAPSKEELLLLITQRWYERVLDETLVRLAEDRDPLRRLRIWIDAGIDIAATPCPEFWDDARALKSVASYVDEVDRGWKKQIEEFIRQGIESGQFRSINTSVVAVVMDAVSEYSKDPEVQKSLGGVRAASEDFFDVILYGLQPKD